MSNSLISTRTNGNIYMYVARNINITKYWKINVQNICYLCNNSVCKERYFLLSWFCDMKMFWHVMVGIWLQKLFRRRKQVWKYFWWSDLFLTQWIFCEKREIMADHQRYQRMMANNILCAILHTTLVLLFVIGYSNNVLAMEVKSLRK